jgi:HK97 family phage major capsid protein
MSTGSHRAGNSADPARRSIDQAVRRGMLPEAAATVAEHLVMTGSEGSKGIAARWAAATGDPHYESAFFKLMADKERGHMLWTPEEQHAYQQVQEVRASMGTGPGVGGEMLPLILDPAILLTSAGSINPLRQISRVVQTTGDSWNGVTSAGVTAEWKAESAQAAEATPTLAQANIPVYFGDAFTPYSYEIGMDGLEFARELAKLLVDAADQLQATAFTTGAGTTEPTGFITALAGTASEVSPISPESFFAQDVYALQNALPPRFQSRARWVCALPTLNTMAQWETDNGARLFPELSSSVSTLLRRPLHELSNMRSTDDIDEAQTADNPILCYGDFSEFVIADRIGSHIEIIPNLFGANQRPTGERGAFLWFRTGSDVVVNNAFRVLNVATSA